jgi:hypothetical protein
MVAQPMICMQSRAILDQPLDQDTTLATPVTPEAVDGIISMIHMYHLSQNHLAQAVNPTCSSIGHEHPNFSSCSFLPCVCVCNWSNMEDCYT